MGNWSGRGLVVLGGLILGMLFSVMLSSCGGQPPVPTVEGEQFPDELGFVDWNQLDYKFWRRFWSYEYFFRRLHVRDPYGSYRRNTNFNIPYPPVVLAEFKTFPAHHREARRQEARAHLEEARKLKRTIDQCFDLYLRTFDANPKALTDDVIKHEMGPVTPALSHLKAAVALDPSNAVACFDLAYFSWLVGDAIMQRQALEKCVLALEECDPGTGRPLWRSGEDLGRLRLRALLDQAWAWRSCGEFAPAVAAVQAAGQQMKEDDQATYDLAFECNLLEALLCVDVGETGRAKALARHLPSRELPRIRTWNPFKSGAARKESEFACDWVYFMASAREGERDQALAHMQDICFGLELPPHLNHRYWQDRGQVLEQLKLYGPARMAYGYAFIYHPYYVFFPMDGGRGNARVTDQTGCGRIYYRGYRHFYVGGSLFSYAANRLVAMDMAEDTVTREETGIQALEALSACVKRGIRPASSLALRGQVHYRLNQDELAIADLAAADAALAELGRPSGDVKKLWAIIEFQRENYEACLEVLRGYTDFKPQDGFGWRTAGVALINLERYEEARNVLERALRVDPGSQEGYFNLGLLYLQTGDDRGGRHMLSEMEARFPAHPSTLKFRELVEHAPGVKPELAVTPVILVSAADESQWFPPLESDPGMGLLEQMKAEDLRNLLAEMKGRYEKAPDARQRVLLARLHFHLEELPEVEALLAPLWPDKLTLEEGRLLLEADLALGLSSRAREMTQHLESGVEPLPDLEFWDLVSRICQQDGALDEAHIAERAARSLDPDRPLLSP